MKRIMTFAICAVMMTICSITNMAQDNHSKKQNMNRVQLAEAQAKHIAHELALDDVTTQKLVKTFSDYQQEVWALGPRLINRKDNLTDAEAEQAIKQRMERSQKILDLREKYYKRYSQFLTQKQIERAYELEHKAMQRLSKRGQRGQGNRGRQH